MWFKKTSRNEAGATSPSIEQAATSPPPEQKVEQTQQQGQGPNDVEMPPLMQLVWIMLSLYLSFFLVALDRTIIGTAIPKITDEFHSLDDIGWYGSAYMLTNCAFQLVFGRIFSFFNPKWVYLIVIGIFEVGSAICGAAPNSVVFIIGRAIAGLGSAGIFTGGVIIIVHTIPLHKRPMYMGFMGAIFGVASVAGPLLGGVFTTDVSWRWCFYINLPVGAVTVLILLFILKMPETATNQGQKKTLIEKLRLLDPLGTLLFLPGIVCLILALQWGGSTYAWSNGRIIALLVLFAVLIIGFILRQALGPADLVTLPPRIATQRSIIGGSWYIFCLSGSMFILVYYLPTWFQAIKGVSAVRSGIMNLPMILGLVITSILTGIAVKKIGYYTQFIIAGSVFTSIGAGLITTFTPSTGHAHWIGYQAIWGIGAGMSMQQVSLAAQTTLSKRDVPIGIALTFFSQQLGGALFVSIGQSIFTNRLAQAVGELHIPGVSPRTIADIGATDLRSIVPAGQLPQVLSAYNYALRGTFEIAVAMAALSFLGAILVEFKSIKQKPAAKDQESGKATASETEESNKNGEVEKETERPNSSSTKESDREIEKERTEMA